MRKRNPVTVISHHFPSVRQPYLQTFIKDHVEAIKKTDSFTPELLHIHPKMLPFTERWKNYKSPLLTDIPHSKKSYFSVPAKKAPHFVSNQIASAVRGQIDPDENRILHMHWLYPGGIALPKLKEAGFTCALTIHGSDWLLNKQHPKLRSLFLNAISAADIVFTSGPFLRDDIQQHAGADTEIKSLYNYIDTKKFSLPGGDHKKALKKSFGWDDESIHALTIANIRHEKGIDVLLEAISETPENLHFHVIGQQSSSTYVRSIKEKVEELNSKGNKITLYPPIPREELVNYYQAADFYVLPSRSEGFNVSRLEALACGLPVVTTNVGGAEVIISSSNGLIIEPDNPQKLAAKINEMSQQFPKYDKQPLHTSIADNFSLEAFSQKLQENYQQLI